LQDAGGKLSIFHPNLKDDVENHALINVLNPKKVVAILGMSIAVLLIVHTIGLVLTHYIDNIYLTKFFRNFNVDQESNIPTFFSSVLILFCAFILGIIALVEKKLGKSTTSIQWGFLGIIFLILAIDESATFHEGLTGPIENILSWSGVFQAAWIIPYGIFFLVIALTYFRLILSTPTRIRNLIFLSSILYISGAIGMEVIGGYYRQGKFAEIEEIILFIAILEEALEMVGIVIFIYSLLTYVETKFPSFAIKISSKIETPSIT